MPQWGCLAHRVYTNLISERKSRLGYGFVSCLNIDDSENFHSGCYCPRGLCGMGKVLGQGLTDRELQRLSGGWRKGPKWKFIPTWRGWCYSHEGVDGFKKEKVSNRVKCTNNKSVENLPLNLATGRCRWFSTEEWTRGSETAVNWTGEGRKWEE